MIISLGILTFVLIVLAIATGFIKTRTSQKLHEYLALLFVFSLFLHIIEKFTISFECLILFLFLSMTVLTGLKKFKTKHKLKSHKLFAFITLFVLLWHIYATYGTVLFGAPSGAIGEGEIKLPEPSLQGETSIEEALLNRRSVREYSDKEVPLKDVSQLLWAAQGITSEWGGRTAPSAGATYPLELYVHVRKVEDLDAGIYHYNPRQHSLNLVKEGDFSDKLMQASLNQQWIKDAAFNIVVTAEFSRTTNRYGERGEQYVYLEAGHAAQNIYLQVSSLELGCVVVGAFNDESVKDVIGAAETHDPLYVIPVGFPI